MELDIKKNCESNQSQTIKITKQCQPERKTETKTKNSTTMMMMKTTLLKLLFISSTFALLFTITSGATTDLRSSSSSSSSNTSTTNSGSGSGSGKSLLGARNLLQCKDRKGKIKTQKKGKKKCKQIKKKGLCFKDKEKKTNKPLSELCPKSCNTCPQKEVVKIPPTDSPTRSPTNPPTNTPTDSPTRSPTRSSTKKPPPSPTIGKPTDSPTNAQTNTPTDSPTRSPTKHPTSSPTTSKPTDSPTNAPTNAPTDSPTRSPTKYPTSSPTTSKLTDSPTNAPTNAPTDSPTTNKPADSPSNAVTEATTTTRSKLTESPTNAPTNAPTDSPTRSPTKYPTSSPTTSKLTDSPTNAPTNAPTDSPTTNKPADSPSNAVTEATTTTRSKLTESPTNAPTNAPTDSPTRSPTKYPTSSPTTSKPTDSPSNAVTEATTITTSERTDSPTNAPTNAPTDSPTRNKQADSPSNAVTKATTTTTSKPTESPTNAPTNAPTDSPIKEETTCFDYTKVLDIGKKDCSWNYLFHCILETYIEQNDLEETPHCSGGLTIELRRLTGTIETNGEEWKDGLQDLCDVALYDNAMNEVETVGWERIEDANVDIGEYFNGQGFLNNDYGNLQQKVSEFERRGGYERFLYVGTDVTKNDYLPTPQRSVDGGEAIKKFFIDDVQNKFLSSPSYSKLEGGCPKTNAAMCCWSRDRQYIDNNGSCHENGHCRNGNPGDNTDLCWTTTEGDGNGDDNIVYPYPTQETEGPLHCHGYSWTDNDISDTTKNNNLFFISMYDHLYTRGYVQSITDDPYLEGEQPMCGCVEDMNPVARADCTEIVPRSNYTAYQNEDGYLVVEHKSGTFELEYKACEGYDYNVNVTPDDWITNPNINELGLKRQNNDLSAYVYRQYLEGKKDIDQTNTIEETIIGYKDPTVNDGDNQREVACKAAFEKRYPDKEWVVITPVNEEIDEE